MIKNISILLIKLIFNTKETVKRVLITQWLRAHKIKNWLFIYFSPTGDLLALIELFYGPNCEIREMIINWVLLKSDWSAKLNTYQII
jgi:hypothetical protein